MSDILKLSTNDPAFNPDGPVMINGRLFLPAAPATDGADGRAPVVPRTPRRNVVVEVKRRKLVQEPRGGFRTEIGTGRVVKQTFSNG